jgi:hypothetical protein
MLVFNTLLALVVLNLLLWVVFLYRDHYSGGSRPSDLYPEKSFAAVYPGYTTDQWKEMMKENWTRPCLYGGYLVFKEAPYAGKYVNVTEVGFRKVKGQGPWPPSPTNFNVFVFGGSTMFGYGVADEETFASYLQEELGRNARKPVCVYNFGAGYYYSTQERIFLQQLLSQGHKPDLAMFVDGLNDYWHPTDNPDYGGKFEAVFNAQMSRVILGQLPMMRALGKLRKETDQRSREQVQDQLRVIPQRYQRNLKMVEATCREFGITPVFVWQPVPSYKYDTKYHLFYQSPKTYQNQAVGFVEMAAMCKSNAFGKHFLWCADVQEDKKECLYVDAHHYTARFAKELAQYVAGLCRQDGLLQDAGFEAAQASNP